MKARFWIPACVLFATLGLNPHRTLAQPLDPSFSYQGLLKDSGAPLDAPADFRFRLFTAAAGGTQIGTTQAVNNVAVASGQFTVELNFGAGAFNGDKRYLDIAVRSPAGSGVFTTLLPRQSITAAPYALKVPGVDGSSLDAADGSPTDAVFVDAAGNVGIGTVTPAQRLHVAGPRLRLENAGKVLDLRADGGAIDIESTTNKMFLHSSGAGGNNHIVMQPFGNEGNVGIGTENPVTKLQVVGTTRTTVIEITGADLAEKFPTTTEVDPGMVVAIDPGSPGKLCLARGAYNRCVAGIVSGANDFAAGAILGNLPGDDDAPPVALTGRVYVWCDASSGAIEPGDFLTTSDVPGHAMKAADHTRAQGAILGKAMTGLASGRGLVLVLVSLQ